MPLAYSPVTMSFDAEYPRAGNLLWSLRDLATTVEVRDFEARPIAQEATAGDARSPKIHVVLTFFAYARADAGRVRLALPEYCDDAGQAPHGRIGVDARGRHRLQRVGLHATCPRLAAGRGGAH